MTRVPPFALQLQGRLADAGVWVGASPPAASIVELAAGDDGGPLGSGPTGGRPGTPRPARPNRHGTSTWWCGSKIRTISPSMEIARGTQMWPPKERVMRSAMLVLPLPEGPNRNMPLPEAMAGPSWSNMDWSSSRSANARSRSVRPGPGVGDALGDHRVDVVLQGDRSRSEVRAPQRQAPGGVPTVVGDLVQEVVDAGGPAVPHESGILEPGQALVDQHVGEPDLVGDGPATGIPTRREELQDQALDLALGQAGRRQGHRLRRGELLQPHGLGHHQYLLLHQAVPAPCPTPRGDPPTRL